MGSVRHLHAHDPRRRYTAAEFAALAHEDDGRIELDNGKVIVSAPPAPAHMLALGRLFAQIDGQLPERLRVFPRIGVHIDRITVRVPDLVIAESTVDPDVPVLSADRTVLVVEIVSPDSEHVDTNVKPFEYADAGIPFFWLVDPTEPATVSAYSLAGDEYHECQRGDGTFEVDVPVPLRIDLDALSAGRGRVR